MSHVSHRVQPQPAVSFHISCLKAIEECVLAQDRDAESSARLVYADCIDEHAPTRLSPFAAAQRWLADRRIPIRTDLFGPVWTETNAHLSGLPREQYRRQRLWRWDFDAAKFGKPGWPFGMLSHPLEWWFDTHPRLEERMMIELRTLIEEGKLA